ncbi:MAG: ABC transporter ATP-binding protein [Clostridiales bacterium]|jgi:ABC-type nitrate/sulfonate/bicarbonate transport system ATPase subunit|nr:ABC transporter ATP-binding protein [Clostridiales bacterium]
MVGEILIKGVSKTFERTDEQAVQALKDINLHITPGSFVSLIGPSGCGKSTLLRLIAGIIKPDSGELYLDGAAIEKPNWDRGFVFQRHTLFPWLNMRQNIAFGLKIRGLYNKNKSEVDEWINLVGLSGFERSYPHQLSGGMCQRASLARALIMKPKALLMDEPLGALDALMRMNMQDEFLRVWSSRKMTMIMVTHDVDEAVYLSEKVIIMSPRPGEIDRVIDIRLPRPRARSGDNFVAYRKEILDRLHFGGEKLEPNYYL